MALKIIKEHPLASIIFLVSIFTFFFRSMLARELTFDTAGTIACFLLLAAGVYLCWVAKES